MDKYSEKTGKKRSKSFRLDVEKVRLYFNETDIPDGWELVDKWTETVSVAARGIVVAKGALKSQIHKVRGNCGLAFEDRGFDTPVLSSIPALILPRNLPECEKQRLLADFVSKKPRPPEPRGPVTENVSWLTVIILLAVFIAAAVFASFS